MITFAAELELAGKTATGITVPPSVVEALGSGKRPPVRVTINGHTYRSSVGTMGGVAKIPVSAAVREAAGVAAGERLEVRMERDEEPREVTVPDDLAKALAADTGAREFFAGLSYSRQKAWVSWVKQAKRAATRQQRVRQAAERLAQHRAQP